MSKAHAKQQKVAEVSLKDGRKASNPDVFRNYTELQLKVINGEMRLEELDAHALPWFYKKAIVNHDLILAEKIKMRLKFINEDRRKRNSQHMKETMQKIRNHEEIQWRQPKTNEYTPHQQQIVRNEIPLNEVHTNELISIHMKAKNLGDYALSDRILSVIHDRRAQRYLNDYKHRHHPNKARRHQRSFSTPGSQLGAFEKALLDGDEHWSLCSEGDIKRLISKLEQANDVKNLLLAQKILHYKQNPKAGWHVTTHKDALSLFEKMMNRHLRRPETWFVDDE